jgi:predicted membrane protein
MFKILTIFVLLFFLILLTIFSPNNKENFEKVKIKLKQNPINFNINNSNNCGNSNTYPDVIIPVYAPWKSYWFGNQAYPYYPFYPFYYNNYFAN